MQITINRDGENFGPYSLEEVRDLLANGTLKETDLAYTEGSENWTPVSTLPGLQSSGKPEAKSAQSKEGGPTTFPCSGCGGGDAGSDGGDDGGGGCSLTPTTHTRCEAGRPYPRVTDLP